MQKYTDNEENKKPSFLHRRQGIILYHPMRNDYRQQNIWKIFCYHLFLQSTPTHAASNVIIRNRI